MKPVNFCENIKNIGCATYRTQKQRGTRSKSSLYSYKDPLLLYPHEELRCNCPLYLKTKKIVVNANFAI